MKFVLTIAGSDPTGGAGIQADLKTISTLNCYSLSAITAITSQTTNGMKEFVPVDPQALMSQILHLYREFNISAVKLGIIALAENVKNVTKLLIQKKQKNIVLDPIIFTGTGLRILDDKGIDAIKKRLIPESTVVTPNLLEASILANMDINGIDGMEKAAKKIANMGVKAVLVKGGHLAGDPVDVLYNRGKITLLPDKRIPKDIHGAGCALSSAIASFLAQGKSIDTAVKMAKEFTSSCITAGFRVSRKGKFLLKHFRD